jgi:surface polysaccharide O-acyltransferase-like enzyme
MYLAHIIVLNAVHSVLAPRLGNPYLRIPAIALTTFVITYLAVKLLSLLPKSKYLVG